MNHSYITLTVQNKYIKRRDERLRTLKDSKASCYKS